MSWFVKLSGGLGSIGLIQLSDAIPLPDLLQAITQLIIAAATVYAMLFHKKKDR